MNSKGKKMLWGLAIFFVAASVLSWPKKSPQFGQPILTGAQIDPATMAIIVRSCGDCHSENTHYLWYSYIVPSSLLVNWDVSNGRRHMDLTNWQSIPPVRQERLLTGIANQTKNRDMPVPQYTLIHRNAILSDAEIDTIFRWTQAERARLMAQPAAPAH